MSLSGPVPFRPSRHSGFARGASESAFPGLWVGLKHAHMPCLGHTGANFPDYAGLHPATQPSGGVWASVGGPAVHMDTLTSDNYPLVNPESDRLFSGNGDTVLCWYQKTDAVHRQAMVYGVDTGTTAEWFGAQFPWSDSSVYAYYGGNAGANRLVIAGLSFGNDVWVHRAGTLGHYLWQNGTLVGSNSTAVTKTVGSAQWRVGAFASFGNDLAYVRAVMVWDRELTGPEIQLLSKDPTLPFRLRQPSAKPGLAPIPLSDSDSLSLTESPLLSGLPQTESDSLSLTESDSISTTVASYTPLIITNGQVQELPTSALLTVSERTFTATNGESSAITRGQAVYISADDEVSLARANSLSTCDTIGLVFDESIGAAGSGKVHSNGIMEATTAEWDAVTGDTGGLTAGSRYYVSPSTAGSLTTTATTTTGEVQAPVGIAVSTTKLKYEKGERVLI